ncbi:MAG: DUF2806 domain-containing protein [Planctomycetes bacterium]|nr:DUF2806 domain-containing protein [Planctomycetota bacterium]
MADGNSLITINLGELSKPATLLIEKISDAVGGLFKPRQIVRVARAEAQAAKIAALNKIDIRKLQRRAKRRFWAEEARKQANMESIAAKALPGVGQEAHPEDVDNDWIANFFDKCRIISDEEMQVLWAKVLAGEANAPGTYSKRTVNALGSLDKRDAQLFTTLCGFVWLINNTLCPLVFYTQTPIYTGRGIHFNTLQHLANAGLVTYEGLGMYDVRRLGREVAASYFSKAVRLRFPHPEDNRLDVGSALLSSTGQELAPIAGAQAVDGFFEFVVETWRKRGIEVIIPDCASPGDGRPEA